MTNARKPLTSRKTLKKYVRASTFTNWNEFKKQEAKTKKFLNGKKTENFKQFCSTLNRFSSLDYVRKKIKSFKNRLTKRPTYDSGIGPDLRTEAAINELCPPAAVFHKPKLDTLTDATEERKEFSQEELNNAIEEVKAKSAPGKDHIDYLIIKKNLKERARSLLLYIFNCLFKEGILPTSWKEVIVYLIPKPNSTKTRPISLTSCMAKIMERMIKTRLKWIMEHRQILSTSQMGFRRKKSCIDNLAHLTTNIRITFAKNLYLLAIFLDIRGAYDNVVPGILRDELTTLGISNRIIQFIYNLIGERNNFFVSRGELQGPFKTGKGLLQGSVLSPLLYAIYTRNLEKEIGIGTQILQYADDIVIYRPEKKLPEGVDRMTTEIARVDRWMEKHGLELAPEKTNFVVFTRKRLEEGQSRIRIK